MNVQYLATVTALYTSLVPGKVDLLIEGENLTLEEAKERAINWMNINCLKHHCRLSVSLSEKPLDLEKLRPIKID